MHKQDILLYLVNSLPGFCAFFCYFKTYRYIAKYIRGVLSEARAGGVWGWGVGGGGVGVQE